MDYPGFIGPTYQGRSRAVVCDRAYNLIPRIVGADTGKNRIVYHGRPGLKTAFCTLGAGTAPVRDLFEMNGQLFAVCGTDFYEINSSGVETDRGDVSASGSAQMVGNGTQVLLVVNGAMHCYTISTTTFNNVSPGFTPSSIAATDNYFIASEAGKKVIWISGILDGTSWNALDYSSKEGFPDNLVGIFADHRQLFLTGNRTSEFWYNSGNADFPFEYASGGFVEQGCIAIASIGKLDNSFFWVAQDKNGWGLVMRADGYKPQRISNHSIEYWLNQSTDLSAIIAWTLQKEGHSLYCLYDPSLNSTLVFDASSGFWHEETYYSSGHTPHLGRCHANCFGKNLVGSRLNDGNIYELDFDTYQDAGSAIMWERIAPHVHSERNWIFYDGFKLDIEAGIGLNVGSEDPGYDPKMNLCFSDDYGNTWSTPRQKAMGKYQEYKTDLEWRTLGRSKDRIFRCYNSEPVKQVWINAHLDAEIGTA